MKSVQQIAGAGAVVLSVTMLLGFGLSAPAQAGFVVDLTQQGNDVVASGSGSLNLTDLTVFSAGGSNLNGASLAPFFGTIIVGSPNAAAVDLYTGFTGPNSFGPGIIAGFSFLTPSSGSGDQVGIFADSGPPLIFVPHGYVSGNALMDTSTFDNETLASLGATPGTYVWQWGSGVNADSFTLQIGLAAAAVPEPATLALLGLGLAGVGFARRKRGRA